MNFLRLFVLSCLALFFLATADEVDKVDTAVDDGLPDLTVNSDDLTGAKTQPFEASVNRLMEIIIHSLYTDRDIFIRELISNAADALDKIRYRSLTDKKALGETKNLEIKVKIDKDANTITIVDTGVGMTADELAKNLGTVAHSGTAAFLDKYTKATAGDGGDNPLHLIGQFGVGFYSAFLVADEVTVISKSNDDDTQNIWHSKADGAFTVTKDSRGVTLGRGSAVILKLKEDARSYLESAELERVITRYSEFMQYPLKIWSSKTEMVEEAVEEDETETKEDDDGLETTDEDTEEKPKTKQVEKTVWFWKQLNQNRPLWSRRPKDITPKEYNEFYQTFAKETSDPITYSHFRAEGEIEFDSILYVPEKAPHGMYDNYYTSKSALRLYVRRVLVADKFEDIIPRYLNFIKGLVDSNDLPLNVNREQLQKNKVMKVISKKLTRKAIDMIRNLAKKESKGDEDEADDDDEDKDKTDADADKKKEEKGPSKYSQFWDEFGKSVKLGIIEDQKSRKKLMELLRFPTSKSDGKKISLQTYVDRMKDGQKSIFFISGASVEEVEGSPVLEKIKAKNIEVLYYIDNLDEYLNLDEYDDYKFQSIAKEGVEIGGKKYQEYLEKKEDEFEELIKWYKEVLGSNINKVQLSRTLENSPLAVITTKYGYSAHMERISKSQAFGNSRSMGAQKILELNYRHPLIKELNKRLSEESESDELKNYALLLYDMGLVSSGFDLTDGTGFASRISDIVTKGLGVTDTEIEAEPEFAPDSDEDDADEDDDDDDEKEEDYEEVEDDEADETDADADADEESEKTEL